MRNQFVVAAGAAVVCCVFSGIASGAPIVVSTAGGLDGGSPVGSVRYRNMGNSGGGDMYLGVDGLGTAANRVETAAHTWVNNVAVAFAFAYDAANDRLTSTLGSATLTYNNFAAMSEAAVGSTVFNQDWNALHIGVTFRQSALHSLSLTDLELNGVALATSTLAGVFSGTQNWQIWGFDFSNSFTIEGNIALSGPSAWSTSQELNAINMGFGYDADAVVVPLPTGAGLAFAGLLGLGVRRRRAL